jgi:hypothetical protein
MRTEMANIPVVTLPLPLPLKEQDHEACLYIGRSPTFVYDMLSVKASS